jgi:two-component sensor histidine kinase
MDTWQSDRAQARDEPYHLDLDLALDAARIGAWEWDPATDAMSCNQRMRRICRISRSAVMTFDAFLSQVRVEDRSCTRATLLQTFRDGESRSVECRLADSNAGTERWIVIEGRPCVLADSAIHMLGTARDISARKMADVQRELAASEMEHRIQNVFTVMRSIVSLSQRFATTPGQLASSLEARIGALARAHGLLQRARSGGPVELQDVIEGELAPFTDLSNVSIHGASIRLGNRQAVAMNVIMHELTTNAVKYGALSHADGQLSIDWATQRSVRADCLVLRWKEYCVHPIVPPKAEGLGLKFLTSSARTSLRGNILLEFDSTGLLATLVAPVGHLTDNGSA